VAEFVQVEIAELGCEFGEVLVGVVPELAPVGGWVLPHVDIKGIRECPALFCLEIFEVFDDQVGQKCLVELDAAYGDPFDGLGVKECAFGNLDGVSHVMRQKPMSLRTSINAAGAGLARGCDHINLVSSRWFGQPETLESRRSERVFGRS